MVSAEGKSPACRVVLSAKGPHEAAQQTAVGERIVLYIGDATIYLESYICAYLDKKKRLGKGGSGHCWLQRPAWQLAPTGNWQLER